MYTLSCNVDQNHGGNQTIAKLCSSQIEKANMTPVGGKQGNGDDKVMRVTGVPGYRVRMKTGVTGVMRVTGFTGVTGVTR